VRLLLEAGAEENVDIVTAFLKRAVAWFANHNITWRRLMTNGRLDNPSRLVLDLLTDREIRLYRHPTSHPPWNGNVERSHQNMDANGPPCQLPQQGH
jgi:hypothetical protein